MCLLELFVGLSALFPIFYLFYGVGGLGIASILFIAGLVGYVIGFLKVRQSAGESFIKGEFK